MYVDGPSEPLKAAFLAELRRAWARANPQSPTSRVFRAAESSVEEILAAHQSASLFSPRELVILLDVQDLGRSEKRVQALAAGLAHAATGSSLVIVEAAADAARKTLEPLRAACAVRWTAWPANRRELLRWGERRVAHEDVTVESGVLEAVLDACEGDALAYFNELDKLCTFVAAPSGKGRITVEDVARLQRPVVGADIPDYLAAVALGDPRAAAQRLGRLLATGVGEGLVLWSLSNMVGGALGGWARHRDLSMTLARRSSPHDLARAMDALYRAEAAWKGGRADVVAVLEQATRAVCGAS
jgi:DNA polymerase III delta subunit